MISYETTASNELELFLKSNVVSEKHQLIQASKGWASLGLRDIWEYRELLVFWVAREIKGAYRQTALGSSWLFLRPILNMLVLTLVFGRIVKVPTDGVPYPIFSLVALLPWSLFSNGVTRSSRSLVDHIHVISKVYFPRMVIPISGALSGLPDSLAAFAVLLVTLLLYRMPLRWEMLLLPGFFLIALIFSLAIGMWLATLSVKYRDVSFAVLFLIQVMMYLSPVIYPVSLVPPQFQALYQLNPMAGVIQGFRWALLGSEPPPGLIFLSSILIVIIALISGAYIFRRTERTVVDIL